MDSVTIALIVVVVVAGAIAAATLTVCCVVRARRRGVRGRAGNAGTDAMNDSVTHTAVVMDADLSDAGVGDTSMEKYSEHTVMTSMTSMRLPLVSATAVGGVGDATLPVGNGLDGDSDGIYALHQFNSLARTSISSSSSSIASTSLHSSLCRSVSIMSPSSCNGGGGDASLYSVQSQSQSQSVLPQYLYSTGPRHQRSHSLQRKDSIHSARSRRSNRSNVHGVGGVVSGATGAGGGNHHHFHLSPSRSLRRNQSLHHQYQKQYQRQQQTEQSSVDDQQHGMVTSTLMVSDESTDTDTMAATCTDHRSNPIPNTNTTPMTRLRVNALTPLNTVMMHGDDGGVAPHTRVVSSDGGYVVFDSPTSVDLCDSVVSSPVGTVTTTTTATTTTTVSDNDNDIDDDGRLSLSFTDTDNEYLRSIKAACTGGDLGLGSGISDSFCDGDMPMSSVIRVEVESVVVEAGSVVGDGGGGVKRVVSQRYPKVLEKVGIDRSRSIASSVDVMTEPVAVVSSQHERHRGGSRHARNGSLSVSKSVRSRCRSIGGSGHVVDPQVNPVGSVPSSATTTTDAIVSTHNPRDNDDIDDRVPLGVVAMARSVSTGSALQRNLSRISVGRKSIESRKSLYQVVQQQQQHQHLQQQHQLGQPLIPSLENKRPTAMPGSAGAAADTARNDKSHGVMSVSSSSSTSTGKLSRAMSLATGTQKKMVDGKSIKSRHKPRHHHHQQSPSLQVNNMGLRKSLVGDVESGLVNDAGGNFVVNDDDVPLGRVVRSKSVYRRGC